MIGRDIQETVYRDTTTYYASGAANAASPSVLAFVQRHLAGTTLDLGCATGTYTLALQERGVTIEGADINSSYVALARKRGVQARVIEGALPYPDRSFDSVILLEVLEHLPDPDAVLREAARVARTNVILTTPNSAGVDALRSLGLLFEHFADRDHRNFFTPESLTGLLAPHFASVTVEQGDPINPLGLAPWRALRVLGNLLARAHVLPPRFFFRLFAVARV